MNKGVKMQIKFYETKEFEHTLEVDEVDAHLVEGCQDMMEAIDILKEHATKDFDWSWDYDGQ